GCGYGPAEIRAAPGIPSGTVSLISRMVTKGDAMVEVKLATFARRIVSTAFALALSVCSVAAFAATTQRPISDFLSTQGTFCVDAACTLFVPPTPNFVGFTDTVHDLGISFDYAGLSDQ